MVIGGGLICYGPDIADQFRQATRLRRSMAAGASHALSTGRYAGASFFQVGGYPQSPFRAQIDMRL
jgi:hypothetical protein